MMGGADADPGPGPRAASMRASTCSRRRSSTSSSTPSRTTPRPATLLADAFEQIGYQQESPSVRNSFLAAALELRSGIPEGAAPKTSGPDLIRALSTGQFLDFLGIRLDPDRAADGIAFTAQPHHPGQRRAVRRRAEQRHPDEPAGLPRRRPGPHHHDQPLRPRAGDDRAGPADGAGRRRAGRPGRRPGRAGRRWPALLVHFELGFEIMPGTGPGHLSPDLDPFAQEPLGDTAGG